MIIEYRVCHILGAVVDEMCAPVICRQSGIGEGEGVVAFGRVRVAQCSRLMESVRADSGVNILFVTFYRVVKYVQHDSAVQFDGLTSVVHKRVVVLLHLLGEQFLASLGKKSSGTTKKDQHMVTFVTSEIVGISIVRNALVISIAFLDISWRRWTSPPFATATATAVVVGHDEVGVRTSKQSFIDNN